MIQKVVRSFSNSVTVSCSNTLTKGLAIRLFAILVDKIPTARAVAGVYRHISPSVSPVRVVVVEQGCYGGPSQPSTSFSLLSVMKTVSTANSCCHGSSGFLWMQHCSSQPTSTNILVCSRTSWQVSRHSVECAAKVLPPISLFRSQDVDPRLLRIDKPKDMSSCFTYCLDVDGSRLLYLLDVRRRPVARGAHRPRQFCASLAVSPAK